MEVNTSSEKSATTIKNDIDRFLKEKLFPKLEKMLDEYHPTDALIRFRSLQLDLSVSRWENEREITEELEKKLTQFFRKNLPENAIPENGGEMISPKIPEVGFRKEKHIPPMEPSGKEFSGVRGKAQGLPGQGE